MALILKYTQPLDFDRRSLFREKNFGFYPSSDEVREEMEKWNGIWNEENAKKDILLLISTITGVHVLCDIEMWVFGAGLKAMSAPFLMPIMGKGNTRLTRDEFLETTIHEVIHRFIGDPENNSGIKNYWDAIRKEYAEESVVIQNHILLYAVLEEVMKELFSADDMKKFIHPTNPEYQRAYAIVQEKGSEHFIRQFKEYLI